MAEVMATDGILGRYTENKQTKFQGETAAINQF